MEILTNLIIKYHPKKSTLEIKNKLLFKLYHSFYWQLNTHLYKWYQNCYINCYNKVYLKFKNSFTLYKQCSNKNFYTFKNVMVNVVKIQVKLLRLVYYATIM